MNNCGQQLPRHTHTLSMRLQTTIRVICFLDKGYTTFEWGMIGSYCRRIGCRSTVRTIGIPQTVGLIRIGIQSKIDWRTIPWDWIMIDVFYLTTSWLSSAVVYLMVAGLTKLPTTASNPYLVFRIVIDKIILSIASTKTLSSSILPTYYSYLTLTT